MHLGARSGRCMRQVWFLIDLLVLELVWEDLALFSCTRSDHFLSILGARSGPLADCSNTLRFRRFLRQNLAHLGEAKTQKMGANFWPQKWSQFWAPKLGPYLKVNRTPKRGPVLGTKNGPFFGHPFGVDFWPKGPILAHVLGSASGPKSGPNTGAQNWVAGRQNLTPKPKTGSRNWTFRINPKNGTSCPLSSLTAKRTKLQI